MTMVGVADAVSVAEVTDGTSEVSDGSEVAVWGVVLVKRIPIFGYEEWFGDC